MLLKSLFLQNFRNYKEAKYHLTQKTNLIVGPNAIGKTNLLEAIFLLSVGKSFRASTDDQMIRFGEQVSRVGGVVRSHVDPQEDIQLQVVVHQGQDRLQKKYSINGVAKHRNNFAGRLTTVLFLPTDLDIVIGQPSQRRRFLDDVLEQVDQEYSLALSTYTKALRQRNALLEQARETGIREEKTFVYWDSLLITQGQIVARKREEFVDFINQREKELFGFEVVYDKSEISEERLEKYRTAEIASGVTLVGPHRDDLVLSRVKYFASRGQQRLVVLELKLSQIAYIEKRTGERPVLILDDIFSELDESYTQKVLGIVNRQQSIITTTEEKLIHDSRFEAQGVIELKQ